MPWNIPAFKIAHVFIYVFSTHQILSSGFHQHKDLKPLIVTSNTTYSSVLPSFWKMSLADLSDGPSTNT